MLLANVGSPDGPDAAAVRRFLAEFLSDPSVVELPRILWLPLLFGVVLPLRSRSSARLYAKIWTSEGSPLIVHSRRQRDALENRLGPGFRVELGMRYGSPSLVEALDELVSAGCRRIVLAPLFPQASFATTGSVLGKVERLAGERGYDLRIQALPTCCADEGYIRALADRVRRTRGSARIDHHVFSFHGLPEKSVARGDPYRSECEVTARLLARELAVPDSEWTMSFQSRFGRRWLGPWTDDVVRGLAKRRLGVLVATPGFAADCLETLEEIGVRLRESFHAAGGSDLLVVPALNDDPPWIETLARLVRHEDGRSRA